MLQLQTQPIPVPLLYLALLIPVAWILRKPILKYLTPRGIPGIPALRDPAPLWGDILRMGKRMTETGTFQVFFDEVLQELGPIAQIRVSFFFNLVLLADLQEIESVFTRHGTFDRSGDTIAMFRTILPTGQLSQRTNTMWKHHRRIIGPAMTSKYLSLTTPRANEAVRELIELFAAKAKVAEGKGFQAEVDMEGGTMDAICKDKARDKLIPGDMAFGVSWGISRHYRDQVEALKSVPEGEVGEAVFKLDLPPLAQSTWYIFQTLPTRSTFPGLVHFFSRLSPSYRIHHKRMYGFLEKRIVEARAKAKVMGTEAAVELADNTLDMMVARELKGEDWMPDNEMKDELFLYLLAGTETSATTLSWWLKYMTNHPEVQHKLRNHLLERLPALQDRPPTYEDLNATTVPYLEAVVHEALRLSRTAGGYTRQAMEDTVVLGHRVPKGTILVAPTSTGLEDRSTPIFGSPTRSTVSRVNSSDEVSGDDLAVRRSERLESVRTDNTARKVGYWAAGTGKRFMPERWLDEERFDQNAGPSLPFSIGQRACFGKNLAMLELRVFITQLTLAFFFAPVPEEQNSFVNYETVTNHPKQCIIRPVRWDSEEARA